MNFIEYYKGIENKRTKQSIRERIVERLGINQTTFYSWLHRGKVPEKHYGTISAVVGMPKTELFPEC